MTKNTLKYLSLSFFMIFAAFIHFYGIDRIVLNIDEIFRVRALISSDWDLFKVAWPEQAIRTEFKDWPVHLPPFLGLLMRGAVVVLGPANLTWRIWPWFFGVLAIWAVFRFFQTYSGNRFAWLALVLVGLACSQMFEFSKSMKHFTADVFFCSWQYILAHRVLRQNQWRDWLGLTLISAIGIWFAFGVMFTTAAIFLALLITFLSETSSASEKIRCIKPFLLSTVVIGLSAALLYVLIVKQAVGNKAFISHISHDGLQLFNWTRVGELSYWVRYLLRIGYQCFRISIFFFKNNWIYGTVANLIILYWLWRMFRQREWFVLLAFTLPVVFFVLGSFANMFPLQAYRVISFLLPAWIVMITTGLRMGYDDLLHKNRYLAYSFLFIAVMGTAYLSYLNCRDALNLRFGGGRRLDKVMAVLMQEAQDQDTVFLHHGAILAFYIYATDHQPGYREEYPIKNPRGGMLHVIYGHEFGGNISAHEPQFQQVENVRGRLWVAFGHLWPSEDMLLLEQRLKKRRTLLKEYDFKKCKLLLFAPLEERQ